MAVETKCESLANPSSTQQGAFFRRSKVRVDRERPRADRIFPRSSRTRTFVSRSYKYISRNRETGEKSFPLIGPRDTPLAARRRQIRRRESEIAGCLRGVSALGRYEMRALGPEKLLPLCDSPRCRGNCVKPPCRSAGRR